MKKIFTSVCTIIFTLFMLSSPSEANTAINPKIEAVYQKFSSKIEKTIINKSKRVLFYEDLNTKLTKIWANKKIASWKLELIYQLKMLINESIFNIDAKLIGENSKQKFVEISEISKLKKLTVHLSWSEPYRAITTKNNELDFIKVNDRLEYIDKNTVKRVNFTWYVPITLANIRYVSNKKWLIIEKNQWEYWYVEKYSIEEKIPYSQVWNYTKANLSFKKKYVQEWEDFYSYNFGDFIFYKDVYWIYKSDIEKQNLILSNLLLYRSENNSYNFVKDYERVQLIDGSIIFWVTDKSTFLTHIADDKRSVTMESDDQFLKLKTDIVELTKDAISDKEKIRIVYDWLLSTVTYTQPIDLENKQIFSGIYTYKNRDGVCEWYVKLISYALKFAWVKDAVVIRGDVIDAKDFPTIGHAWLKVWDKYYDPTFDDPIWSTETKRFDEYKYYALPKDLLYANRFDYWVTPSKLKTTDMLFRERYVAQRLSKLSDKYSADNYNILQEASFLQDIGITPWEKLTIKKLSNKIWLYEVDDFSFFGNDKKKRNIKTLKFYEISDKNVLWLMSQIDYNLADIFLFDWKLDDGTREYRLAYDVQFR